jgi:hypothetical protein
MSSQKITRFYLQHTSGIHVPVGNSDARLKHFSLDGRGYVQLLQKHYVCSVSLNYTVRYMDFGGLHLLLCYQYSFRDVEQLAREEVLLYRMPQLMKAWKDMMTYRTLWQLVNEALDRKKDNSCIEDQKK